MTDRAGILGMPTGDFLYADQLQKTLREKAANKCASTGIDATIGTARSLSDRLSTQKNVFE